MTTYIYKFLKGVTGALPLAAVASTNHQVFYTILATMAAGAFHALAKYLEQKYNIKPEA